MAAGGEEPPLPGCTEDDGYAWSVAAFKTCSEHAEQKGVTLVLENHWGFTGTAAGVLRILRGTASPWLKVVLDTGNFNFRDDPYAEMAALAPFTAMVHAKTYTGGGIYYTAELDYPRIAAILREAGFGGYVSLEFEGRAHPDQGIPTSLELLRESFGVT
jgi:sugar phosphate isomerase/epimerase